MRSLLLAVACVVLFSSGASACRGLWEYPQTMAQVAKLDISPARKESYKKQLEAGYALHEKGRTSQNPDLMKEAVKILDDIKIEIRK